MTKQQARIKAMALLIKNGFEPKLKTIEAPETNSPLEAISIQNELDEIVYSENEQDFVFRLQYIGNNLKLVPSEI